MAKSMLAMRNNVLEAEKVSGRRFGRRPKPGAQTKAPNLFARQVLPESGAVRFARQYWRWQKNQEFARSRWRKCREEAENAAPREGRSRKPEYSRKVARGLY